LATSSFALCFAAWGLVSAFAPRFRQDLGLSQTETEWQRAGIVQTGRGRVLVKDPSALADLAGK
jgi:hypothetical protein